MTEREKPGDKHDWIDARQKCTVERKFAELLARVQEDVKRAKGFTVASYEGGRELQVTHASKPAKGLDIRVSFSREADRISIGEQNSAITPFEVTIALDEYEECQFFMDGRSVRAWEITKRALEPIFFKGSES